MVPESILRTEFSREAQSMALVSAARILEKPLVMFPVVKSRACAHSCETVPSPRVLVTLMTGTVPCVGCGWAEL